MAAVRGGRSDSKAVSVVSVTQLKGEKVYVLKNVSKKSSPNAATYLPAVRAPVQPISRVKSLTETWYAIGRWGPGVVAHRGKQPTAAGGASTRC